MANRQTVFVDIIGRNFISRALSQAKRQIGGLTRQGKSLSRTFESGLGSAQMRTQAFTEAVSNNMQVMKKSNKQAKRTAGGFGQVNMAFLGVMFAGMQLSMQMSRLTASTKEAFGVSDQFSSMLLSVFAPAMSRVQPLLSDFTSFMIGLDESTKLALGSIVGFLNIVGLLLFIVGSAVMAVQSLASAISVAASTLGAVLGVFVGSFSIIQTMIAIFGKVKGAIIGVITVIAGAAGLIAAGFAAIPVSIAAALGAAIALVFNFWDEIKSGTKTAFNALGTFFTETIPGWWGAIVEGAKQAFNNVKSFVRSVFSSAIDVLKTIFVTPFKEIFDNLKSAFKTSIDGIEGFFDGIGDKVTWLIGKVGDLLKTLNELPGVSTISSSVSSIISGVRSAIPSLSEGASANDALITNGKFHRLSPNDDFLAAKNLGGVGASGPASLEVNVNVDNVSNDVDMREMAREIERRVESTIDGRVSRR
jgi:hypothetical protein